MFLLRIHDKETLEHDSIFLENLGYILGVYWQLDDLKKPLIKQPTVKQDKVMLPLALAIASSGMNPGAFSKTLDELKKKAYNHNKNLQSAEDNANALTKEEYLALFGRGRKK